MPAGIAVAMQLLSMLLDHAQAIGGLISKAQSEGRDLTEAELATLAEADDAARSRLVDEIKKARGG